MIQKQMVLPLYTAHQGSIPNILYGAQNPLGIIPWVQSEISPENCWVWHKYQNINIIKFPKDNKNIPLPNDLVVEMVSSILVCEYILQFLYPVWPTAV